jgi:small-conductance mechanosensitive channel
MPKSGSEAGQAKSDDRRPLYYAGAFAIVVITLAVAYRIVGSSGAIDVKGGLDGIQVKISEAQKTIESAQQQMTDAQRQLDQREAALRASEEALRAREAKVETLLAGMTTTPAAPTPRLSVREARVELDKITAAPSVLPAPSASPARPQLEKLGELRDKLGKTNFEIKTAAKPLTAAQAE